MKEPNTQGEHIIKFTGKASIPEPLKIGHGYEVLSKGEVTTITESDNNNGTHNLYYKFVPITSEIREELGELHIKAKDSRSNSKLIFDLHNKLWSDAQDDPRDMKDSYDDTCKEMMLALPELYKRAKAKNVEHKELEYPDNINSEVTAF